MWFSRACFRTFDSSQFRITSKIVSYLHKWFYCEHLIHIFWWILVHTSYITVPKVHSTMITKLIFHRLIRVRSRVFLHVKCLNLYYTCHMAYNINPRPNKHYKATCQRNFNLLWHLFKTGHFLHDFSLNLWYEIRLKSQYTINKLKVGISISFMAIFREFYILSENITMSWQYLLFFGVSSAKCNERRRLTALCTVVFKKQQIFSSKPPFHDFVWKLCIVSTYHFTLKIMYKIQYMKLITSSIFFQIGKINNLEFATLA